MDLPSAPLEHSGHLGGLRREAPAVLLLLALVLVLWLAITGRFRPSAWQEPLTYAEDSLYYFAMAKASAESHAWPFLFKEATRLNAPYGADWNDFPIVNEVVWSLLGISRKLFGLAGVSLYPVLLAHLLAALGFYVAARLHGSGRAAAVVLGLLFALSPYLLRRSFGHLNLAFAWHVPLSVVVALWTAEPAGLESSKRWRWAWASAFFCGLQSTYYALFSLLLLGGALAIRFSAEEPRVFLRTLRRPALLILLTIALAVAANLDTLVWGWQHGKNVQAAERGMAEINHYALRPIELFLPRGASHPFGRLTEEAYYSKAGPLGEAGGAYLGLVAGAAFLLLLGRALLAIRPAPGPRPPPEAWAAVLGLLFAVAGGGNSLLGLLGINTFRCGLRISILLMAIALLFAARSLAAWTRRRQTACLMILLVIGLFDQWPRKRADVDALAAANFAADAELAARLETVMPGGAIFQLPILLYPEAPRVGRLEPYELLRLYSHSSTLRFSYGAHKGRGFETWQQEVAALPTKDAVARLHELGFSAVAIYGRAYPDRGAGLLKAFQEAGGGPTFSHSVQPIHVILLPR